ncbi:hypothetical protein K503DRAFT_800927 [Rhizopogon vinicolor AM-OR11-026]|uniref:Uncharacterized protein n=1 Tax=Rhizopogon vinicolor AM-OR11-026 TaxID=1314800 RepID=A0A1B7MZ21_9AGAM|nr:hypothetical protein K503DRAFT_800927 [Rhizopogon vinicolor AM-OR11-026]
MDLHRRRLVVIRTVKILINRTAFQPNFLGQGSPTLMENYWNLVNEMGIQWLYLHIELDHGGLGVPKGS